MVERQRNIEGERQSHTLTQTDRSIQGKTDRQTNRKYKNLHHMMRSLPPASLQKRDRNINDQNVMFASRLSHT